MRRNIAKVDLEVKRKEFMVAIESSGTGKNMLLNAIGLLDKPIEENIDRRLWIYLLKIIKG